MNNFITIHGVRGYIDENGTAQLNIEDVSKGLGFTKTETKDGKEYTSIRWERVFGYLNEFHFDHKWAKDGFLPENIFYRLSWKASSETAVAFQATVADEILPSIRKTGGYVNEGRAEEFIDKMFPTLSDETKKAMVTDLQKSVKALKSENTTLQAENKLLSQQTLAWTNRKVLEALVKEYGAYIDKAKPELNGFQAAWREFKKELLYAHGINLNLRISKHMENSGKKTRPKTMDMIGDHELPACISTAVSLCRANGVDISNIIQKFSVSA